LTEDIIIYTGRKERLEWVNQQIIIDVGHCYLHRTLLLTEDIIIYTEGKERLEWVKKPV
jgi:hypothetical protein